MEALMLCYSDADGQHRIALDREMTSIGRSPDQDIVIPDPGVSRRHSTILRESGGYTVLDLNSTHGTFLNGEPIQRAALRPGDLLQLGSLTSPPLRLEKDGPLAGPPRFSVTDLLATLSEPPHPGDRPRPAQEMERLNWLIRAARQLNEGAAIEDILCALLQLTLQLTGLERGFVFLPDDDEMRFLRGLNSDGALVEAEPNVSRRAIQNAIQSGSPFSISDTSIDDRTAEWPSIVRHGIRSIYCIPLRKPFSAMQPGQLLGLLYLDSQIGVGKFTEVDHQVLGAIATEAAVLVHNAVLADEYRKAQQASEELAVAARIHSGLMSIELPNLPYASLQAKTVPCLAIGGDFFDAVALDGCLYAAIADVSGKGVSAAIVAATLQGIIHSQFLAGQSLSRIAALLNHFLFTRNVGKYATLVLLKLTPAGELEYLNCGHIPPLLIVGAEVRRLQQSNLVVGLISEAKYESSKYTMRPGELILLLTDGLTEGENSAGEAFGESGLLAIAHCGQVEAILEKFESFRSPNPAQDDCTLLAMSFILN